jgi:competence transcription factor ComK
LEKKEGGSDINLISPSWMDATMITHIANVGYQHTHKSLLNQQTVQLRLANRSYCNRHIYKGKGSDDRDIVNREEEEKKLL